MKRLDLTRTSLFAGLAFMTFLAGAALPQGGASHASEAENLRIVEGSKVTLQYVASVPGLTGINYANVSEFVQGQHEIFPAVEQQIVGMGPGEEKKIELSPGEGFGAHDDTKKLTVPKSLLPSEAKAGDVLQNDAGDLATVEGVGDSMAVIDYNHPLAGKPLVVQLKILRVEYP